MSGQEQFDTPEAKEFSPWADVFDKLNMIAKRKISDHGRNPKAKQIDSQTKYNDLKVRVDSVNIDKYVNVMISVSRDNSEEDDIRPAKGIDMVWATGEEEHFKSVKFSFWPGGMIARGEPISPIDNEPVELGILDSDKAATTLLYLASFAIDAGNKPHDYS